MSRSTLIPSVIVCLGLALAAVAENEDVATSAAGGLDESTDLVAVVKSLELRVATIEKRLMARQEQEALGRGLVAFEPIVANLNVDNLTRYIRVAIVFAIEDGQKQSVRDAIADIKPNIKDWLYSYLADKAIDDVTGSDKQRILRHEIQAGVNSLFQTAGHPEFVKAILFDEINVQ